MRSFWEVIIYIGVAHLLCLSASQASLIAEWNFDDSNLDPDGGSQISTAELTTTGGTLSFPARGSGNALQLGGSTDPQSFTVALSGTGLNDFEVNYEGVSSEFVFIFTFQTSFDQVWSWSTDNITYSSTGITQPGPLTSTGGYDSYLVSFAGISAIEGSSTVFLRNEIQPVFGGTTALRFDNLSVTAVPEPSTFLLAATGGMILFLWKRHRLKLRRKTPATRGG